MNPQKPPKNPAILTLQLIHVALAMGVIIFTLITLFMQAKSDVPSSGHAPLVPSIFIAVAVVPALFIGLILFRMNLAKTVPSRAFERAAAAEDEETFSAFVRAVTPHYLMRLAAAEGVALFGLVMKFMEGRWTSDSIILISPTLVFIGLVAMTMPTVSKLKALYEELRRSRLPPRGVTR